jgi:hypothetical protein
VTLDQQRRLINATDYENLADRLGEMAGDFFLLPFFQPETGLFYYLPGKNHQKKRSLSEVTKSGIQLLVCPLPADHE